MSRGAGVEVGSALVPEEAWRSSDSMRVEGWCIVFLCIVIVFIGGGAMSMPDMSCCCAGEMTGRTMRVKRTTARVRGMADSSPDGCWSACSVDCAVAARRRSEIRCEAYVVEEAEAAR
jgi:hypothetical protein